MLAKVTFTVSAEEQIQLFGLDPIDVRRTAKHGRESRFIHKSVDVSLRVDDALSLLVFYSVKTLTRQVFMVIPIPQGSRVRRPPIDILHQICNRYGFTVRVGTVTGRLIEHHTFDPPAQINPRKPIAQEMARLIAPIEEFPMHHKCYSNHFIVTGNEPNTVVEAILVFLLDFTELKSDMDQPSPLLT